MRRTAVLVSLVFVAACGGEEDAYPVPPGVVVDPAERSVVPNEPTPPPPSETGVGAGLNVDVGPGGPGDVGPEATGGEGVGGAGEAGAPAAVGPGATLEVDTLEGVGPYLTDAQGRALYLFTADTRGAGESTCYDACATAWPPYLAPRGNPTAGAAPVQSRLLGTIQRRGGAAQVTYNGWPLYYYQKDRGAGTALGQDVHGHGGEWYLIRPSGEKLEGEGHGGEHEGH